MIRKVLITLLLVSLGWWLTRSDQERNEAGKSVSSEEGDAQRDTIDPGLKIIERSLFLSEYGSETGSIENDLEAVFYLVTDCQTVIKNFDSYFLPDNEAITGFLLGGNRDKIAWIPPGHPAVSAQGELIDRWQRPLYFHREGGLRVQIRSAGPDQEMWTADDHVFPKSGDGDVPD